MSCMYTIVQYVGKCSFKDPHLYIDSLCIPEYVLCTLFDPGVFGVRESFSPYLCGLLSSEVLKRR